MMMMMKCVGIGKRSSATDPAGKFTGLPLSWIRGWERKRKEGKGKGVGGLGTERRGKGWEGKKRAKDEMGGKKTGVAPTAPAQPIQPRGLLGAADMTATSRGVQM